MHLKGTFKLIIIIIIIMYAIKYIILSIVKIDVITLYINYIKFKNFYIKES